MANNIKKNFNNDDRIDSFEKMKLKNSVLRGIFGYGFEKPSEIQSRAINPMINGVDIIAQSQSGTGKTGTFLIGTLQRIDENLNGCQAMIIAPTKELAGQIHSVCRAIGSYCKNTNPVLCIGGTNIYESKNELQKKTASLVIGTPGRIIDMLQRKFLDTKELKLLVIDEADQMLSFGFKEQIRKIVEQIPVKTQICLFSATMQQEMLDLTQKFMRNPMKILVKKEELTLEGIKQYYVDVEREEYKLDVFIDIYKQISVSQSIMYVNHKKKAEWLKNRLEEDEFAVLVIHGDMTDKNRKEIMKNFKNGDGRILISTDLTSRGIDIQQVSVVINYDLPRDMETYLHRIGRSGRFGRKGLAINFVTRRDVRTIEAIQNFYSTVIDALPTNFDDQI